VDKLNTMREAPYGMVEETTVGSSDGWRVSFEDQRIHSKDALWDIKENGYPGNNGWRLSNGLRDLEEHSDVPDFNDQVFNVALTDPNSGST
jgi:hypothetical protein